jgi:YD repeat-containing protein
LGEAPTALDKFDRPAAANDPVNATDFTWTYRADRQPASFSQPNGNTTAYAYDATGHLVRARTRRGRHQPGPVRLDPQPGLEDRTTRTVDREEGPKRNGQSCTVRPLA